MNSIPLLLAAISLLAPSYAGFSHMREACPGFPWPDDNRWDQYITLRAYNTPLLGTFRLKFNLTTGLFGMPTMARCLHRLRSGGVPADESIMATAALVNARNEKQRWEATEKLRLFADDWQPSHDLEKDFHLAAYDLHWWVCKPYWFELALAGDVTEVLLRSLQYLPLARPDVEVVQLGNTWVKFAVDVLGCGAGEVNAVAVDYPGSRPTDFYRPRGVFRLERLIPGTKYSITFSLLDKEMRKVGARTTVEVETAPIPPFSITILNGTLVLEADLPNLAILAPGIHSIIRLNNQTFSASRAISNGIEVGEVDSVKACLVLQVAGCKDCPELETCRQAVRPTSVLTIWAAALAFSFGLPLLLAVGALSVWLYRIRRAARE